MKRVKKKKKVFKLRLILSTSFILYIQFRNDNNNIETDNIHWLFQVYRGIIPYHTFEGP